MSKRAEKLVETVLTFFEINSFHSINPPDRRPDAVALIDAELRNAREQCAERMCLRRCELNPDMECNADRFMHPCTLRIAILEDESES